MSLCPSVPALLSTSAPGRLISARLLFVFYPLSANYFLLVLGFPACADSPADLLRGQLRFIALENPIWPEFSAKYPFNPSLARSLPSKAISLHIGHVAESGFRFPLDIHIPAGLPFTLNKYRTPKSPDFGVRIRDIQKRS